MSMDITSLNIYFGYCIIVIFTIGVCNSQESTIPSDVVGTCGGTFSGTSSGYIASPNFPTGNYPASSNCTYIIEAEPGSIVAFYSLLVDLEKRDPTTRLCTDYLELFDGNDTTSADGKFCASESISLNATTGNTLRVVFTSDFSTNARGFVLRWTVINPAELQPTFNCSFDGPTPLCPGWIQGDQDQTDWRFSRSKTVSASTGPSSDHSEDSSDGRFAYIEASEIRDGEYALLFSPAIPSGEKEYCLSFWYHMYGSGTGQFAVLTLNEGEDEAVTIFDDSGNKGESWNRGELTVKAGDKPLYILFRASRGNSVYSDIALDDIVLTPERCSSEETTAFSPTGTEATHSFGTDQAWTTFASSNCTSNDIFCDDGLGCVPKIYQCDGDLDCIDGSDEVGCSESSRCSDSFVWQTCGSTCNWTCADGADGPACTLQNCVQRCGCPIDTPVLHKNRCIAFNECPASAIPLQEVEVASVEGVESTSATVLFESVESADSFKLTIVQKDSSDTPIETVTPQNDDPSITHTFQGLNPDTEYQIFIESVKTGKANKLSPVILIFTTKSESTTNDGTLYWTGGSTIYDEKTIVPDATTTDGREETTPFEIDFLTSSEDKTTQPKSNTVMDAESTSEYYSTYEPTTYLTTEEPTTEEPGETTTEEPGETTTEEPGETTTEESETTTFFDDQTTAPLSVLGLVEKSTTASATTTPSPIPDTTTESEVTTEFSTQSEETAAPEEVTVSEPGVDEVTTYWKESTAYTTEEPEETTVSTTEPQTTTPEPDVVIPVEETTGSEGTTTAEETTGAATTPQVTTLDEETTESRTETEDIAEETTATTTTTTTATITAPDVSTQVEETTQLTTTPEDTTIATEMTGAGTTQEPDLTTPAEETIESTTESEVTTTVGKTTSASITEQVTTLEQDETTEEEESTTMQETMTASDIPEVTTQETTTTNTIEVTTTQAATTGPEILTLLDTTIPTTESDAETTIIATTADVTTTTPTSTTAEEEEIQSLFANLQPGENITLVSDVDESGFYRKDYAKLFNFRVNEGYIVRVTFTRLSIFCDDGIHFFNEFFFGEQIINICGTPAKSESENRLPLVFSESNMLSALFQTNGENEGYGFEAIVDSVPESTLPRTSCGTRVSNTLGEIASPEFPSKSEVTDCQYLFGLLPNQYVEFDFKYLGLERNENETLCGNNKIAISSSKESVEICGIMRPPPVIFTGLVTITLTTEGRQPGFWLSYNIKECGVGEMYNKEAPSCDASCMNGTLQPCTTEFNIARCFCPSDRPLRFEDRCITVAQCEGLVATTAAAITERSIESEISENTTPVFVVGVVAGHSTPSTNTQIVGLEMKNATETTTTSFEVYTQSSVTEFAGSATIGIDFASPEKTTAFTTTTPQERKITIAEGSGVDVTTTTELERTESQQDETTQSTTVTLSTTKQKTAEPDKATEVTTEIPSTEGTTEIETTEADETTAIAATSQETTEVEVTTEITSGDGTDESEITESDETKVTTSTTPQVETTEPEVTTEITTDAGTTESETTESDEPTVTTSTTPAQVETTEAEFTTDITTDEGTTESETTESTETTVKTSTTTPQSIMSGQETTEAEFTTEITTDEGTTESETTESDETTMKTSTTTPQSIKSGQETTEAEFTTEITTDEGTTESETTESTETTVKISTTTPQSIKSGQETTEAEFTTEITTDEGTTESETTESTETTVKTSTTTPQSIMPGQETTEVEFTTEITTDEATTESETTESDETTVTTSTTTPQVETTEVEVTTEITTDEGTTESETTEIDETTSTTTPQVEMTEAEVTAEITTNAGTTESETTESDETTVTTSTTTAQVETTELEGTTEVTIADQTTESETTEAKITVSTPAATTESEETTKEDTIIITTTIEIPTPHIQGLKIRNSTYNEGCFSFQSVDDALNYEARIWETGTKESDSFQTAINAVPGVQQYENCIDSLVPGTDYTLQLRVITSQRTGEWQSVNFTTSVLLVSSAKPVFKTAMLTSDTACITISRASEGVTYEFELTETNSSEIHGRSSVLSDESSFCWFQLTPDTSYTYTVAITSSDETRDDSTVGYFRTETPLVYEVYEQTTDTKEWRERFYGWKATFSSWFNYYIDYLSETNEPPDETLKECPKQKYRPPCKENFSQIIDRNGCFFLLCVDLDLQGDFTQEDILGWEEQSTIFFDYFMPQWEKSFKRYTDTLEEGEKDV